MALKPPPLVPSKNALRALRRLALQGTTIAGAVGSLCGVAAVSYDARQRVKLAEKIIDTKRTINSVSNGRGRAHVQRMFEAAEKGEEFGLDPAKQNQRRKKRNYSALAQESIGNVDAAHEFYTIAAGGQQRPTYSWNARLPGDASMLVDHLESNSTNAQGVKGKQRARNDKPIQDQWNAIDDTLDATRPGSLKLEKSPRSRWAPRNLPRLLSVNEKTLEALHKKHQALSSGKSEEEAEAVKTEILRQPREEAEQRAYSQETVEILQEKQAAHTLEHSEASRKLAAQKILLATQQPLKPGLDAVYARPDRGGVVTRSASRSEPTKRSSKIHAVRPQREAIQKLDRNSVAAEKIIAATQQQHKLASHTVYWKPSDPSPRPNIGLNEVVDRWLNDDLSQKKLPDQPKLSTNSMAPVVAQVEKMATPLQSKREHEISNATEAIFTDIEFLTPKRSQVVVEPKTSQARVLIAEKNEQAPMVQPRVVWSPLSFDNVQDGIRDRPFSGANETTKPRIAQPEFDSNVQTEELPDFEIAVTTGQKVYTPRISGISDLTSSVVNSRPKTEDLKNETPNYWSIRTVDKIRRCIVKGDIREAKHGWVEFLKRQNSIRSPQEYEELLILYKEFRPSILFERHPQVLRKLARYLLVKDLQDFDSAATLLFPIKSIKYSGFTAARYLAETAERVTTPEELIADLRTVIDAAKHREVPLSEDIFAPVLRWLCSQQQLKKAQEVHDQMVNVHQVDATFYTRSIMVCGYASVGDWDAVKRDLEEMHTCGDSRKRPVGYAVMFNGALQHFILQKPIAQVYDYLVHAIGFWGVVPTAAISATIIQACMRNGRYDMIREWVETVRTMFPQVDTKTNNRFSWRIGETWKQINATYDDIEQTCKALAYRSTGEPFTESFRGVVRESLAEDLAKKLHLADGGKDFDSSKDLDDYLEKAYDMMNDIKPVTTQSKPHVETAARLKQFLNVSDPRELQLLEEGYDQKSLQRPQPVSTPSFAKTVSTFPDPLTEYPMPPVDEMISLIQQYQTTRSMKGLLPDHSVLDYVCGKLQRAQRQHDAVQILEEVREKLPEIPFDIDLMSVWLRCASDLRSVLRVRKALYAVLEDEAIRITQRYMLLLKMTIQKLKRQVSHAGVNTAQADELDWLFTRVVKRRRTQVGIDGWEREGGVRAGGWEKELNDQSREAQQKEKFLEGGRYDSWQEEALHIGVAA